MFVPKDEREATILHADLDSFYASVEVRDDPSLRGKPVVAGLGVVLAATYEAKAFGVRTAMPEAMARRLCPHLVAVPVRFDAYAEASERVFGIFHETSPTVEGISVDEAFLDVSGMERIAGSPREIAERLRRRVRNEVGLPITVGVARTKFLAKVASGVGKPDGLLVVEPDGELEFLHPLAVDRLWGVGRVTAAKLEARGIATVGDVAAIDRDVLISIVGAGVGQQLHALAHNIDVRRVETGRRRGSIGSQQAMRRSRRTREDLDAVLRRLVDRVTRRMRRAQRVGRTVTLRFRFDDFERATRSASLSAATSATAPLYDLGRSLLDANRGLLDERGLTLLGFSVSGLDDGSAVQLTLPFQRAEADRLDDALDQVRDRFGSASLTRASTIGHDADFGVPVLPD